MTAAVCAGQRCSVRLDDGRQLSGYIRAISDFSRGPAFVRLDTGECVEVPIERLGREVRR